VFSLTRVPSLFLLSSIALILAGVLVISGESEKNLGAIYLCGLENAFGALLLSSLNYLLFLDLIIGLFIYLEGPLLAFRGGATKLSP